MIGSRVFFALALKADDALALTSQVASLIDELRATPVPATNLHATLCFIGHIETEKLAALRDAGGRARGARATLRFDTLEHWQEPGILCATAPVDDAARPAEDLSHALGAVTKAAGFTPDAKPFRAHLTLARKVPNDRANALRFPRELSPPFVLRCDRFVLMESQRDENGSIYSVVESWLLDAKSPE